MLESLLGGGTKALVGLDISSSSVKLLELSRKGDKYHVEAYACEPLPPAAVNEKQIADPAAVGDAIQKALSRAGTRTRAAAIAVAGASVITKIIQMPATLSDGEMEEQIKVEADQYIPYPIDEVNVDFQVVGPTEKDPNTVDVLLAACRKEQIEQRLAALEIANLHAKVVDIETYALENACQFLRHQMPDRGEKKTIAVVDMGASVTAVTILHDLKTIYTRDQAFGGKQLTEDIMRHYGMSLDEANKAKRQGNLPENYEGEVLAHFLADMAQQIDRSLQFFFSASTQYTQIDQVVLAGGCAHIANVDRIMQERLKIPTVVARPFAEMSIAARAKPQQLAKEEASLLIACGLAFRAFDEPRV
ncbi:MAG: pilus assembly protein PilM [Gammaproteobacteria bacterium]|nr:pilus assembly protein PilM [Gammaproteobacteria bacterium]